MSFTPRPKKPPNTPHHISNATYLFAMVGCLYCSSSSSFPFYDGWHFQNGKVTGNFDASFACIDRDYHTANYSRRRNHQINPWVYSPTKQQQYIYVVMLFSIINNQFRYLVVDSYAQPAFTDNNLSCLSSFKLRFSTNTKFMLQRTGSILLSSLSKLR